ncbi:YczI family protein [Bacillus sp. MHSD_36]|uniref:YczI family protein n=1 Tax=unclassified Bacillus (in: firmicutes) TaxID=185979 RepID=UPI0027419B6D|nr:MULTISPECIES: YczI family protein [unclassified Bacillus (in: firmicutes)]MDP7989195.1 YczI family protein [Bacillus sp. MHSD_36]MDR4977531.1 YczI family protein [Bacillus sp. MHSD_37]
MNRILTILLAIIIMGYSIYSWDDASKQSVLILQMLLGCMLVSMGVQNFKNNEKENRSIGIALLLVALFLIVVSFIKYFK